MTNNMKPNKMHKQIETEDMSDDELMRYFSNFARVPEIEGIFDSYGNVIDPTEFTEEERKYWQARLSMDGKILFIAKAIYENGEIQNEFADMEYEGTMKESEEMEKIGQDADGSYNMTEFYKTHKTPINWMIEQGYIAVENGKYVKDGGYLERSPKGGMTLSYTKKYYDYIYIESIKRAIKAVLAKEKRKKKSFASK